MNGIADDSFEARSSAITAGGGALNKWLVFARLPTLAPPSYRTTALTDGERRQRAHSGHPAFSIAVGQPNPGSSNLNSPKRSLATSPYRPQVDL